MTGSIIDVFPPNQQRQIAVQLSMVLQAVVSQQLVPSIDGRMVPAFEIMTVTPAIRNMIDLTGKNAIVTGAAQGLSLGMAEGLMEAGAKVCIIDVNPKAEEVAKEKCAQGYDCHAVIIKV